MLANNPHFLMCGMVILTIALLFWIPSILLVGSEYIGISKMDSWVLRLAVNLCGYGTVLLPGYILLKYFKNGKYNEQNMSTGIGNLIRFCFLGRDQEKRADDGLPQNGRNEQASDKSSYVQAGWLVCCTAGLLVCYGTWGWLQEKIMTKEYTLDNGAKIKFTDSQFLVFVNRISAFILSGSYILMRRQPRHTCPLYLYSLCSFSNVMSSWCQYEALKYVGFLVQVIAKASKIIPVMLMGKIVFRKTYEYYEYASAVVISAGMLLFLLGSPEEHHKPIVTTISGVVLLVGYMVFDSFTSNWQNELYTQHKMTSMQMMCGVNLYSCLLTFTSLIQQGALLDSLTFMVSCPKFAFDVIVLSACSALGQLFVFLTIQKFGAVVFVTIMTIRQGQSVLLSSYTFNHSLATEGWLGVVVVFLTVFVRIYIGQRLKTLRRRKLLLIPDRTRV